MRHLSLQNRKHLAGLEVWPSKGRTPWPYPVLRIAARVTTIVHRSPKERRRETPHGHRHGHGHGHRHWHAPHGPEATSTPTASSSFPPLPVMSIAQGSAAAPPRLVRRLGAASTVRALMPHAEPNRLLPAPVPSPRRPSPPPSSSSATTAATTSTSSRRRQDRLGASNLRTTRAPTPLARMRRAEPAAPRNTHTRAHASPQHPEERQVREPEPAPAAGLGEEQARAQGPVEEGRGREGEGAADLLLAPAGGGAAAVRAAVLQGVGRARVGARAEAAGVLVAPAGAAAGGVGAGARAGGVGVDAAVALGACEGGG